MPTKENSILKEKKEVSNKLSKYIIAENWEKAERLLSPLILKNLDSYWLLSNYAIILYELRKYTQALEYSNQALIINKADPLLLNYHAAILKANNKEKSALKIWENIINSDINDIAFKETGEGILWAKSLVNDIRYNVAITYLTLKKNSLAFHWLNEHLINRKRGQFSLYKKRDILKRMENISHTI